MFEIAKVSCCKEIAKDAKKAAYDFVAMLTSGAKAKILSGANEFNGVVWFNKELLEASIILHAVLALICEKEEEAVLEQYKTLLGASQKAEYKCENLLKPFAPKVAKAASKSSAKKTDAKPKSSSKSKK